MITRCPLCPGKHHCIGPSGPIDADLLFIGEAPGHNEERKQQVFIGKTGEEVNRHYLPLAGLRRERVCFTNAIRCLPVSAGGKLDPSRAKDIDLLESCVAHFLYPQIEGGRYQLLVPLGSFACRAVFGEGFDLELRHGFPTDTPWGIPAFPMYHPALGIHEPKKMLLIRNDWDRLRRYLKGTLRLPVDPHPQPDYREIYDIRELEELDPTQPIGCDTESDRQGHPFCFTYAQAAGSGRLVRASNRPVLDALSQWLRRWDAPVLFHNYLYDWDVCRRLGLAIPYPRVVDTMSLVFHLGNLPQGLKALAWRELGMAMQDFADVVTPHSRELVLHYYEMARTVDWPKPEEQLVIDNQTGQWKLYKPQSLSTKLKRFFTDYQKNPEKDVFEMWTKNWTAHHAELEAEIGPWPGICITHVPFEKALHYACRDADATLRLWPVLRQMARQVRKRSQERWRDA